MQVVEGGTRLTTCSTNNTTTRLCRSNNNSTCPSLRLHHRRHPHLPQQFHRMLTRVLLPHNRSQSLFNAPLHPLLDNKDPDRFLDREGHWHLHSQLLLITYLPHYLLHPPPNTISNLDSLLLPSQRPFHKSQSWNKLVSNVVLDRLNLRLIWLVWIRVNGIWPFLLAC